MRGAELLIGDDGETDETAVLLSCREQADKAAAKERYAKMHAAGKVRLPFAISLPLRILSSFR